MSQLLLPPASGQYTEETYRLADGSLVCFSMNSALSLFHIHEPFEYCPLWEKLRYHKTKSGAFSRLYPMHQPITL